MLSARDFELLLPWYLNGTLGDAERNLVAAYLEAHPEEAVRVDWNASLRGAIKAQVHGLPEDLGLTRALAVVRPESRTDWIDRLRSTFARGRPGFWAVAPASVALIAGTVIIFLETRTPTPTPPAPAELIAHNTVPVQGSGVQSAPGTPEKPSEQPSSIGGMQRGKSKQADRSGGASEGPQPQTTPSPTNVRTAPSQVALGPAGTASPLAGGGEAGVPGPTIPAAGSESESHTAHETSTSPYAPVLAQPSAGPSTPPPTASLPADRSSARESAPGRVALSGKTNTSCPSTNKQREDALRALYPDQPVRTPAAWLVYIRELLTAGCLDAANREWIEFHKKYPDQKAPPGLEISE